MNPRPPPMAQWVADTPNHDHVAMPSTTMAMAFLAAVIRWADRQAGIGRVAIPTGRVDADELRRVVCALVVARGDALGNGGA